MRAGRIVALVAGVLLLLGGLALLAGGGALGLAHLFGRDADGYYAATLDRIDTETVAVTTEEIDLRADPGSSEWLLDRIDADVRLRVTGASSERAVFVGVAPEADVDAYLAGVAHAEVVDVDDRTVELRDRSGGDVVAPPTEQDFWAAETSGTGTQELVWEPETGRWAAVLMNADGSAGVAADVQVGARASFVGPLALILLAVGAVVTICALALVVVAASAPPDDRARPAPAVAPEAPATVADAAPAEPIAVNARLDPGLSRWLWLVKWFLAIPHFVILVFLWFAFVALTFVAGVAILFTGRYPRRLFSFNVGVLRWSWRVQYYAAGGGLGTDRYPPFRLSEDPTYPAALDVTYPERLSRGLVLVKWWLLAIPHYLVLAVIAGGGTVGWRFADDSGRVETAGMSLLTVLALIVGGHLLFANRYPRALFDLIVGLNRWVFRVVAYAALMTDRYPPFRLDQGGADAAPPPSGPDPSTPGDIRIDRPEREVVGAG